MANGGSWDRFWFTIAGFYEEYGRWPTKVLWPEVVQGSVEAHLNPSELKRLQEKLVFIPATGLAAEDDIGGHYDYAGPAGGN